MQKDYWKQKILNLSKIFLIILLIMPLFFCIGLYIKKYNNTVDNIFIQCESNHPDFIRVYYNNGAGFADLQSRYYFFSYNGKTVINERHIKKSQSVRIELHSNSKQHDLEYRMKIYYKGQQCNPYFLENATFYNAKVTFLEDNTIIFKYTPQEEHSHFSTIVLDYTIDSSSMKNYILTNTIAWYQYNYIIANYKEYFLLLGISFLLFLLGLYQIKLERLRNFLMIWFSILGIFFFIFVISEVREFIICLDKKYLVICILLSIYLSICLSNLSSTIKSKFHSIIKSNLFFYTIIAIASSLCFCAIYGLHILNPQYVDYLKGHGDLTQHYLGWVSFRNSPWMFPLGMMRELTYPFETSVIFTDSIPLFAIFFKLFHFCLPYNFQYFGFWGMLCFILQGALASKILQIFLKNKIQIFFASLIFVISPVMIFRMYGHTALAGHWILLLALYAFLSENMTTKKECILWAMIGFLSSSIHIYFVAMNCFIIIGIFVKNFLNKKSIKQIFLPLGCYLVTVFVTIFLLGGFSSKTSNASAGGLGYFSMNLNAFLNPQGWSYFFKDLPYGNGQYEGFSYLGAGIIFLLMYAVFQIGSCQDLKSFKTEWKKWLPFVLVFFVEFAFATSHIITFGNKTLFVIPLPKIIIEFWSIFRSTGRFSWVCVYLIIIFSIKYISSLNRKQFLTVIIIFSLFLQLTDIHGILKNKRQTFNQIKQYSSEFLESPEWKSIANNDSIKHFLIAQEIVNLYELGDMTLKNKKTLNRFIIAHYNSKLFDEYFNNAIKNPSEDSIYIFLDENKFNLSLYNLHYYLVGKYIIGSPKPLTMLKEYIPNKIHE